MTAPATQGVRLGHAIVALIEPHAGHERDFHVWYDLDHFHVGAMAPRTFAAALFAAPPALRALRTPRPCPLFEPVDAGRVLSLFWIEAGGLDEAQHWMQAEMQRLGAAGRLFPHRDHVASFTYDFAGGVTRDADAVPPELLLSQDLPGVACVWLERAAGRPLEALCDWLLEPRAAGVLQGGDASHALAFTLRPKPDWWPASAPQPPGLGERLLLLLALDAPPERAFPQVIARLHEALAQARLGQLLLAAPFSRLRPGAALGLGGQ